MQNDNLSIESLLFYYFDKVKFFFFPDQWSTIFIDYSKNDIFAMIFIYRRNYVNMTEIATDLNIPLNTATGIISRLEKKRIVKRERNSIDKRVVTISLTEEGREFIKEGLKILEFYLQKLIQRLTEEETKTALQIIDKIFVILSEDTKDTTKETKKVKRILVE